MIEILTRAEVERGRETGALVAGILQDLRRRTAVGPTSSTSTTGRGR